MTTNLGTNIIQEKIGDKDIDGKSALHIIEETKNEIFELLKKSFIPEFINRIDEIIMFRPLSKQIINKITLIQLEKLKKQLLDQKINISFDEKVVNKISREGFNPQFGARPIKRLIRRLIIDELSKKLLAEKIDINKSVFVYLEKDSIFIKN